MAAVETVIEKLFTREFVPAEYEQTTVTQCEYVPPDPDPNDPPDPPPDPNDPLIPPWRCFELIDVWVCTPNGVCHQDQVLVPCLNND